MVSGDQSARFEGRLTATGITQPLPPILALRTLNDTTVLAAAELQRRRTSVFLGTQDFLRRWSGMQRPSFPLLQYFLVVGPVLLVGLFVVASWLEPRQADSHGLVFSSAQASDVVSQPEPETVSIFHKLRALPIN